MIVSILVLSHIKPQIFGCESSPISRNVRSSVSPSVSPLVDKCKVRPIKAQ